VSWASCGCWYEMRSVSCQMAMHSRHVARRWRRLCQLHEAEYVKRRSCRAHWSEAGCRHSAGRVLTDIVEQHHGWCQTLKYTVWTEFCATLWQPVELLQERWCMRPGRSSTEKSIAAASCTGCRRWSVRLWAAGKQTVTISVPSHPNWMGYTDYLFIGFANPIW